MLELSLCLGYWHQRTD